MASNLGNQSRNVLSKKLMVKKEESLDNITLFSIMTIMSFILSAPLSLLMEGIKFTPSHVQSAGLNLTDIYVRSLLAALCFHAYQQLKRGRKIKMHSTHLLLEQPIRMASILEPSKPSFFPTMTKIVGMLGPKSRTIEVISACLNAGMSVSRFDFSWRDAIITRRLWKISRWLLKASINYVLQ